MPQVPTTNRDKAQDAPNAWEEGATIEEWAPFYFDANKLLAALRARAECVVPREAWAAHVAAASKKRKLTGTGGRAGSASSMAVNPRPPPATCELRRSVDADAVVGRGG
jgi:hypothetical protein